jgi:hypothetical protein
MPDQLPTTESQSDDALAVWIVPVAPLPEGIAHLAVSKCLLEELKYLGLITRLVIAVRNLVFHQCGGLPVLAISMKK